MIHQFTVKDKIYMRLSKLGYLALRDRGLKQKVAEVMGVTENTIYRWIKIDSDDLTKLAVLDTISKETGLTMDQLLGTKVEQLVA